MVIPWHDEGLGYIPSKAKPGVQDIYFDGGCGYGTSDSPGNDYSIILANIDLIAGDQLKRLGKTADDIFSIQIASIFDFRFTVLDNCKGVTLLPIKSIRRGCLATIKVADLR